jgi:hypothetical protein
MPKDTAPVGFRCKAARPRPGASERLVPAVAPRQASAARRRLSSFPEALRGSCSTR